MADEPIRDLPPAEPFDVPIVPDAPPAEPFDVPITLDPPPFETFDVRVSPDGPPFATFDVPVTVDPPPVVPFDVPVQPDGPPAKPVDVQVVPDPPPSGPFQVPIASDLPPADPVDVPIMLDLPPVDPVQVDVNLDAAPAVPVDVPVQADHAPAVPVDVPVTPSTPPTEPFDVPIFPSPPVIQLEGAPGEPPTMDQIVNAVMDFDRNLGNFLSVLVDVNPITINGPGGGALDPTLLARWFRDYTNAVGPAGVAKFVAEQTVLYAMNDRVARIFDPTYFLKMLIPGSMGHIRTALDVETGLTMERVAQADDQVLQANVNFSFGGRPAGNGKVDTLDTYGPSNPYTRGQAFTVDTMVDTIVENGSFANVPLVLEGAGAERRARFNAAVCFEDRRENGLSQTRGTLRSRAEAQVENVSNSTLARSNFVDGVVPASILGEQEDGSVLTETPDPSSGKGSIDDDDARVPLSFTDLRKDPVKNAYRSVYFRPLNLAFSTALSPEWIENSSFGRTDAIVGYQKTSRTVTLSFEVVAFSVEDLQVMYNKMTWLTSMCYPTYGSDSLMRSGPVCRLRIGDAVSTGLGGVPGVIRGLTFDFAEALWELRKGMKVPRSFKVSVDFLVLHDGPVGILNGAFGVLQLPSVGKDPARKTNLAGGPTDSRDGGVPDGATVLPGMFSRFGEPRR